MDRGPESLRAAGDGGEVGAASSSSPANTASGVGDGNSATLVEQYAVQVLDFTSQYGCNGSFSYTAENCLGLPSAFPHYGEISVDSSFDDI